jgi:hypothetical protein
MHSLKRGDSSCACVPIRSSSMSGRIHPLLVRELHGHPHGPAGPGELREGLAATGGVQSYPSIRNTSTGSTPTCGQGSSSNAATVTARRLLRPSGHPGGAWRRQDVRTQAAGGRSLGWCAGRFDAGGAAASSATVRGGDVRTERRVFGGCRLPGPSRSYPGTSRPGRGSARPRKARCSTSLITLEIVTNVTTCTEQVRSAST